MDRLRCLILAAAVVLGAAGTALAAPPAPAGAEYIVAAGDTLFAIAERLLGNGEQYPAIVEATNLKHAEDPSFAEITDPTRIAAGWKLWIPSALPATATPLPAPGPGATAVPVPPGQPTPGGIRLAVIGRSQQPLWAEVQRGVQDAAARLGVQADFLVPDQADPGALLATLEQAVGRGYNGIAVAPGDPQALAATIRQAVERGIPIITLDSDAPDTGRLAFVGTDNVVAGALAGHEMLRLLPDGGRVAISSGSLSALNSQGRLAGLRQAVAGSAITIVEPVDETDDAATALERATLALVANPDLAGALGLSAANGPAWVQAIKDQGLSGRIEVVCFEATDENIALLKQGVIDALIAPHAYLEGYKSVELLALLARQGNEAGLAAYGVPADGLVEVGVDVVTWASLADYAATLDGLGVPHTWQP